MTDIDRPLAGHLEHLPAPGAPPLAVLAGRARTRSRRRARAVGLCLSVLTSGGVVGGLALHGSAQGGVQVLAGPPGAATAAPAALACTAPVGSAVPDCPVTPDSPEPCGHPLALPPGFAMT